MKTSFLALGLAALAGPALAQSMPAGEYVAKAGAGDLYEITSSRLVLETTQDAKVRRFANMMVQHHSKSTADVKAAAARANVPAGEPALDPAQTQMIADLRAQTGPARDAAYVSQQKTAHDQALAVHRGYAASGDAAPLKQAATKIVPVVQSHIRMLGTM